MGHGPKKTTEIDLNQQVTYLLARLNAKLTAQAVRILRETSDLSLSQWRLLAVIDSRGPISMAEFTRITYFDKGQTSRVVTDLLKRDLIDAQPAQNNRRIKILSFTPRGRKSFDAAAESMKRRREHLFLSLSSDEHSQLAALMSKLGTASDQFKM